jgi:hypothetical protein
MSEFDADQINMSHPQGIDALERSRAAQKRAGMWKKCRNTKKKRAFP